MDRQLRFGFSIRFLSMTLSEDVIAAVSTSKRLSGIDICPEIFEKDIDGNLRKKLRSMLNESGLRVETVHALFGTEYDFSLPDAILRGKALESVNSAISLAGYFSAPIIVVHASGEPIGDVERPARLATSRNSLVHLAELCNRRNIKLAVEFLPRSSLGNTVDELLGLIDLSSARSPYVCLDVNHMGNLHATVPQCVRRFANKLHAMHLSDCDTTDERHWLPGKGVIDWKSLMAACREVGFRGPFIYECVPDGRTMLEKIQSIDQNVEWLSSLFESA